MLPYTLYILWKWTPGTTEADGRTYTDASGGQHFTPSFFSQIYLLCKLWNHFSLGHSGLAGPSISGKCLEVQTAIAALTITGYYVPATNALPSKREWQCLLGRLLNSFYYKTVFSVILCCWSLAVQIKWHMPGNCLSFNCFEVWKA